MKKFLALILTLFALHASAQTVNRSRMLSDPNYVAGTSYTFVPQDATRITVFTNAGNVSVSLPNSGNQGFGAGYLFTVANQGAGVVTITPVGSTIKGNSVLTVAAGQGCDIYGDNTNYAANCGAGTGSGGSSAQGPLGTVQGTDGAGNLTTTALLDLNGVVNSSEPLNVTGTVTSTGSVVNGDATNKGPNPWVDIRAFGARSTAANAAPAIPGITGNINSGSAVLSISAASTFQNGDYLRVDNAGPAITLATPGAPSITPSLSVGASGVNRNVASPTGATSYTYSVFASTTLGGYTPASTATTIVNGLSTLGSTSATINTCAAAGQVVTCSTTTPHNLAVGAVIFITRTGVGSFGGVYRVASVADTTHFTYSTGFDTLNGASTSTTAGTVYYWQTNHVAWTHVPNAFIYYICRGSSVAGVSLPDDGALTDGALAWDDYGTTMSGNYSPPYYIPTSCPVSGQNDPLIAQINSGAATTTLNLSASASNTVTGANVLFDNAPAIRAAANAAAGFSTVYIPTGTFPINSYLTIPANSSICQTGNIVANATIQLGSSLSYNGDCIPRGGTAAQFSPQSNPIIFSGRSNPTVYVPTPANTVKVSGIQFQHSGTNNALLVLVDQALNLTIKDSNFFTGSTSADLMGRALVVRASEATPSFQLAFSNTLFFSGTNNTIGGNGSTLTPLFACMGCGETDISGLSLSGRGIFLDSASSGARVSFGAGSRIQGNITPYITTYFSSGNPGVSLDMRGAVIEVDTGNLPLVANFSGPFTSLNLGAFIGPGGDGVSIPPLVSGTQLSLTGTAPLGYKGAVAGSSFTSNFLSVSGTGEIGYAMSPPAAPLSCVVSAGGAMPIGTFLYTITAVDTNVGQSSPSATSCSATTSPGNQTVTIVPPVLPNGAVSYFTYRSGFLITVGGLCNPQASGVNTTDSLFGTCGTSVPTTPNAAVSSINSTGVTTPILSLAVGGFTSARTGTFTANRAITELDATYTPAAINVAQSITGPWSLTGGSLFAPGVRSVTGTSDTILSSDNGKLVRYSNASAIGVTLPQATTTGFGSGAIFHVQNNNSGAVSITPTTSTINNAGALTVTNGQSFDIYSDGTNYWALGGAPAGGSGITTLDTLTASTQTFSTPNSDANVGITITPSGANHAFLATWTGTLAKARNLPTTVYTDQTNSYTAAQTFPGGDLFQGGLNAQVGTSYTIASTDNGKFTTFTNASAVAVTLPVASTSGFGSGAVFHLKNYGPGTATITPTTSTIDGLSTLVLASNAGVDLYSNGTNYFTQAGSSASAGTINSCGAAGNAYYPAAGTTVSCDTQVTDNGSGTLTAPTFQASGSNGGLDFTEGTGAGLTPTAGHDLIWGNSTTHRFNQNLNNGTTDVVVGAATTDTFTQKTFNTSGAGNTFQIAGLGITATSGTLGKVATVGFTNPASNKCVEVDSSGNLQIAGTNAACGSGGSSSAISAITAATGANTIASGNNGAQIWNWAQTTASQTAFTFGETTAASGAGDIELAVKTIAGSTAIPLSVSNSLTGTQIFPALSITPTWNTSGVVDAALLINPTNTASGTGSLLIDAQLGGTSQWKVDKTGTVTQLGGLNTGASPPNCTPGTGGFDCIGEGTLPTNVSGTTAIGASSTSHELQVATNGSSTYGMLVRAQPTSIRSTGLTGAVTTATLCAASAGACNVAGTYHIHWAFYESGTACSVPSTGGVTFLLTWTDANGTAHSAVSLPMEDGSSLVATSGTFHFQTSLAAAWASGDFNIDTAGGVISYATGYTACGTGSGTYALSAVVTRIQ